MHTYLESIGFSRVSRRKDIDRLMNDVVFHYDERMVYENDGGRVKAAFRKKYAPDMGISVVGEIENKTQFHPEYYFPFFQGRTVSTEQNVCFEKHAGEDSYAGACDDMRLGATLIFYLVNTEDYFRTPDRDSETVERPVFLSGLAKEGSILIPLDRQLREKNSHIRQAEKRNQLLSQARGGDEKAIESLTMEELGSYEVLSHRMEKEDILSIVDSYLIPYGVECDQYSVLGNITACERVKNTASGEYIDKLEIEVCDMNMDICINEGRLLGEPAVGRRFKGLIWLQGTVGFTL